MSAVMLSQLPPPEIIESLDFEVLFTQRKDAFIALYPPEQQADVAATLALESEPITKTLQENAYLEMLLRQRINNAALACMLPWSTGADLDNLVANWDVFRLVIQEGDESATPPVPTIMESDEALRERTLLAWDGLSVAGPEQAYEYFARSSDGRVSDAKAVSPTPACVTVTVLSSEGDGSASAELLAIVEAAFSGEDVTPCADRVTVQSAEILPYLIDALLTIDTTDAEAELILQTARDRLTAWVNPRLRLGVEVPRSAVDAVLHVPGVRRVDLIGWVDIVPTQQQAAWCEGWNVERAP